MNKINTFYQTNSERLLKQVKKYYEHNNNKKILQEQSWNKPINYRIQKKGYKEKIWKIEI